MKRSFCETVVWYALSPVIFDFIQRRWPETDRKTLRKNAKRNYQAMIGRTPDIGSLRKNRLRVCLAGGMLWLSIYDAMDGKMRGEDFGQMVGVTVQAPILRKSFEKRKEFDLRAQQKKIRKAEIANAASSDAFNWKTEILLGRDEEEYTVLYHQCGLCALGRQEKHEDLIPYMCEMDFSSVDLMGGVLKRTGTLATGADCCDFYICKKGSKWDR